MRRIEIGLMQVPMLFAFLAIGCGDKADDSAGGMDTAEVDSDGDVDADGTVDEDGGPDADGTPDADGSDDTGDTGGATDADGSDDTGDTDADADADADADGGGPSGPTIMDVQNGVYASGDTVTLANVVVSSPPTMRGTGFYIADVRGGEKSGLWVYSDWLDDMEDVSYTLGEELTVTGVVSEYGSSPTGAELGDTETLTQIRVSSSSDIEITGTADVPEPAVVSTATLSVAETAEPWESVLVSVDDVSVGTAADGEITIGDGVLVDTAFIDGDDLRSGDALSRIVGLVSFKDGRFQIAPRGAEDLVGRVAAGSAGSCAATKCAADLVVGDLAITEIMTDPNDSCGGGHDGEYIEVYNNSGSDVDLVGLELSDLARSTYIGDTLSVAAGAYLLLEYGDAPCIADAAGGYPWTNYRAVTLNNDEDTLTLSYDSLVLDQVAYGTDWPLADGVSMELTGTPSSDAHTDNDDVANWCAATSTVGTGAGAANLGSPGAANTCAAR